MGFFLFSLPMTKEEIRRNIIIIALNNLIEDYSRFLETCNNKSQEDEELVLIENILSEAKEMISEYQPQIKRPKWKKDPSHT